MTLSEDEVRIEAVESLIQYKFQETALLQEALHTDADRNKRLAIVGDSVLSLALAEDWYKGNTARGHWATEFQAGVGSNASLTKSAHALGLERFICGSTGGNRLADTVEAILGAIYLDSDLNMAKCKDVADALELLPREQKWERRLEVEGFIMLDNDHIRPHGSKKRSRLTSEKEGECSKRIRQDRL